MDIFATIKNDDLNTFQKLYEQDSNILEQLSNKNLNVLSYAVAAESKKVFEFILEKITPDTILKGNYNPLSLALQYQDFDMASTLINSGKIQKDNTQNILGDAYIYDAPEEIKATLKKLGFTWNDNVLTDNSLNNLFQESEHQRKILEISEEDLKSSINKNTFETILSRKDNEPEVLRKVFRHFNSTFNDAERDVFFGKACDAKNYLIIKEVFDLPGFYAGNKETIKMVDALISAPKEIEKIQNTTLKGQMSEAATSLKDVFQYHISTEKYSKEKKQSILTSCLIHQNYELFNHFLNAPDIDLEHRDENGETPLVIATTRNQTKYVQALVNSGASVNALSSEGDNPLMISIRKGNQEIFDIVNPKMGGYKEHKNNNGHTALNLAILSKDLKMVSELLWGGADITSNPVVMKDGGEQINLDGNSSQENYELDIQQKVFNTFKNLRLFGLNTDQINKNGDTFAHHFVKKSLVNNLDALFTLNINTNITDKEGNNLLMNAASSFNLKIFNSVLKNVAITQAYFPTDFTLKNSNKQDIYELAMIRRPTADQHQTLKVEQILSLHIRQNQPKEEMTKVFNKVLPAIIYAGNLKEIEPEFSNYVKKNNITVLDKLGNNLISVAIFGNKTENFEILTKHFSNQLFIPNNEGNTPINFLKKVNESQPEAYKVFKSILEKNVEPQILDFITKNCESPKLEINTPNPTKKEDEIPVKTRKITP